MCRICGCDSEPVVTGRNLQSGTELVLRRHNHAEHDHNHNHGHNHGHGHGHGHGHDHDHAHEHEHVHSHAEHAHDSHEHVHADGTRHSHPHPPELSHNHDDDGMAAPSRSELVSVEARIVAKNDALAARNRAWLAEHNVFAVNLMSAPGAGKTALLERTIRELRDRWSIYILEGDQATTNDAERIRAAGAPVVQINTGTGCHLDAEMITRGLAELTPGPGSVVVIENVGNLVCPALFDLGEHSKVVILSTTEGEDKPLKYPHMFRAAQLMIINKIDLLPHLDFDLNRAVAYARSVQPELEVIAVSSRTGEGFDAWYNWLAFQLRAGSITHTLSGGISRP